MGHEEFIMSCLNVNVHGTCTNRCQLREKDLEIKDLKQQLKDLTALLWQSETQKKELVKEQKMREQAVAIALATSASVRLSSLCHFPFNVYCVIQ